MFNIEKPTIADIPAMQKLVREEVETGIILDRNNNEMANAIRSYHIARVDGAIVGFGALHIHTPELAEIRSLVVDKNYRQHGYGKEIVNSAVKEAGSLNIKEVLVLTYHKEFFEKLGFVEIPKESLPEQKIWVDCIKCKHFPICNEVSLIKTL